MKEKEQEKISDEKERNDFIKVCWLYLHLSNLLLKWRQTYVYLMIFLFMIKIFKIFKR